METRKKRMLVTILSLMLLTASILTIIVLKRLAAGMKPNKDCKLEDLSGEILSFPIDNDEEVIVNYSKEYYDENEEPRNLIVYVYNEYSVVIGENLYNPDIYYFIIKNSDNEDIYREDNIKTTITGTVCKKNNEDFTTGKTLDTLPRISDGKLYYVKIGNKCYDYNENEKRAYFDYKYIDLNSDFLETGSVEIENLKLMTTEDENQMYCAY